MEMHLEEGLRNKIALRLQSVAVYIFRSETDYCRVKKERERKLGEFVYICKHLVKLRAQNAGRMPVGGGSSSRSGRLARISQSNIRPFGSGGAGGGYGPDIRGRKRAALSSWAITMELLSKRSLEMEKL
ncbi:hypothetical protein ANCCEY_04104 [Ancylostoma ceylanicum]|uniref:Uncharacterized protein n=1 Tax=Ancylostoma ceylanicum TaxID=53326 RepID=A0A0D6MA71_9BILA|nr:hypothetical protein ANCCEY_04104 [Ancylostoma ceylanicum]